MYIEKITDELPLLLAPSDKISPIIVLRRRFSVEFLVRTAWLNEDTEIMSSNGMIWRPRMSGIVYFLTLAILASVSKDLLQKPKQLSALDYCLFTKMLTTYIILYNM
jgi:hypothetical protein